MAPRPVTASSLDTSSKPTLKARFAKSMRTGKLGLAFSAAFLLGGTYGTHQGIEEIIEEIIADDWDVSASSQHGAAVESFDARLTALNLELKNFQELEAQRSTAFSGSSSDAFQALSQRTEQADAQLNKNAMQFIHDITMSGHIGEKEFADYYNALEDFPIDRHFKAEDSYLSNLMDLEETVSQLEASARNECHVSDSTSQTFDQVQSCMDRKDNHKMMPMLPTVIFGVLTLFVTMLHDGRTANAAFEKKFKEMENETKRAKPKKRTGKLLRN